MTEFLYRKNTVFEALRGSRRELLRLWVQKELRLPPSIEQQANERSLSLNYAEKGQLSQLVGDKSHQGLVLEVGPYQYGSLDQMLEAASLADEKPFLLLLDLVHGPQNIGSLLRTAEACGVHGIVIQDRRAPDITPQIVINSAGAAEHLQIARVTNLVRTMEILRDADLWLAGLDLTDQALPISRVDLNLELGIVVGHEGKGLRRLVRERCDFLIRVPMKGHIDSLNVAAAGAIALYAAWQARGFD